MQRPTAHIIAHTLDSCFEKVSRGNLDLSDTIFPPEPRPPTKSVEQFSAIDCCYLMAEIERN